jgi:hypothetical protein
LWISPHQASAPCRAFSREIVEWSTAQESALAQPLTGFNALRALVRRRLLQGSTACNFPSTTRACATGPTPPLHARTVLA